MQPTQVIQNRPYVASLQRKETLLSTCFRQGQLDRVNVLGDDKSGHTGCVNALSWGKGGEVLVSSGDDTHIRLWRLSENNLEQEYPFTCDAVIHTGHRANVFNAQMLPHCSRIVTVAGDRQVRVFDHEKAGGYPLHTGEMEYGTREAAIRIIKCHKGRVKRIITEDSPDLFLTVAEDGTVRQHDLRVSHSCRGDLACSAPLVQLSHELSSISLSPMTPYQFVVAGASPYGYLFDRRHSGRLLQAEWGQSPASDELTTCVRRFGRNTRGPHERKGHEHITGTRMASTNGFEVLLSYSADAIYLYSTLDDPPPTSMAPLDSSVLRPNRKRDSRRTSDGASNTSDVGISQSRRDAMMEEDIERILADSGNHSSRAENECLPLLEDSMEEDDPDVRPENEEDDDNDDDEDGEEEAEGDKRYSGVDTLLPRSRFSGVCNVETVKDVNFLGPRDEYIVSGSDDGNWFMWEKSTGRLHDILEGDGSVVNVIEGHPYLPLVAVSGIDHTIKLFATTPEPSKFSRMERADAIVKRNTDAAAPRRSDLANLLLYYRLTRRLGREGEGEEGDPECNFQ
ncbi:WD40 repeat-like protein [Epithele typhae]|uniref:WD40 repeat-like protein n=1 Tax=Epithele typhae TaxID=378194 RepID=UPI002007EDE6|nr:WD40 repeat-like protein [Epithele typhae]KAH9943437.1 WD40 repeat-like protein [Epithele typhae]